MAYVRGIAARGDLTFSSLGSTPGNLCTSAASSFSAPGLSGVCVGITRLWIAELCRVCGRSR